MKVFTLYHPVYFSFASFHRSINPPVFPGKELYEFDLYRRIRLINALYAVTYRSDKLIQYTHTLVSSRQRTFLNSNASSGKVAVERPSEKKNSESSECRKSHKSVQLLDHVPSEIREVPTGKGKHRR